MKKSRLTQNNRDRRTTLGLLESVQMEIKSYSTKFIIILEHGNLDFDSLNCIIIILSQYVALSVKRFHCTVNYRTIRMENSIRQRHLLANLQTTTYDCLSSPLAFFIEKTNK